MDGRTDCRQIADLAVPCLHRDGTNPGDSLENEVSDSSCRIDGVWSGANKLTHPILNLLLAIGDQVLLGRKVVVDGLFGDFGLPRHVTDGNILVAALGEQT